MTHLSYIVHPLSIRILHVRLRLLLILFDLFLDDRRLRSLRKWKTYNNVTIASQLTVFFLGASPEFRFFILTLSASDGKAAAISSEVMVPEEDIFWNEDYLGKWASDTTRMKGRWITCGNENQRGRWMSRKQKNEIENVNEDPDPVNWSSTRAHENINKYWTKYSPKNPCLIPDFTAVSSRSTVPDLKNLLYIIVSFFLPFSNLELFLGKSSLFVTCNDMFSSKWGLPVPMPLS